MSASLSPAISPNGPRWKPFIDNAALSCYSYYLPHEQRGEDDQDDEHNSSSAFTTAQLDSWFQQLHPSNYQDEPINSAWTDATYKNQLLLRKTAWHTFNPKCTCEYGYSDTWQPLITSQKMMTVLQEITDKVSNVLGLDELELNSVNLNYYPQGGGVGWHADDEFLFDGLNRETRIVSLSLCSKQSATTVATTSSSANIDTEDSTEMNSKTDNVFGARKFQVKRKGNKKHESEVHEILLRHGDLMTMEGMFQKYYLHSVWPGDGKKHVGHELCQGERINLTWRTIVRHLDGSKECRGLVCPLSSMLVASDE